MRYAAVATALVGVAVAADGWESWSTTKKSPDPAESTWSEWKDPADQTTTDWESWKPAPTTTGKCSYVTDTYTTKCNPKNTYQCWPAKVPTTIWADTCTWSDWVDPATKTTEGWEGWVTPAPTTTGKCSYVTEVASTKCDKYHPEHCWGEKYTTTIWGETCTWAPWQPAPTTAECSYEEEDVYTKCHPVKTDKCFDFTITKTIYPTDCDEWAVWTKTVTPVEETEEATWVVWETVKPADPTTWVEWDSTKTVKATVTETSTWAEWEPVTVEAGWSSDGWFGPAWQTPKDDECVHNVVTSYGYPIWKPTPEAAEPVTTWETWKETPTPEAAATTWETWKQVPSPEAPKPKPGMPQGDKGHAPIAPNNNQWAMTYTPYDDQGHCKTQEVIEIDIAKVAKLGFTSIRVYSTDCHTLDWVADSCRKNELKIILGVFITKTGVSGAGQQVQDIITWGQWDIVELIVIGNEAVFQGFCQPEDLAWFIKDCKDKFAAAGYTGGCTTTEPLDQWQKYGSQYCEVVDVVSANLYAYFNAQTKAGDAGVFIQAQINILAEICPGKDTYVMESGWPSQGSCNGVACPGKDEQKTAIKSIQETSGAKVVFFSYENDAWKAPGQFGVEQYWGCADVFGTVDNEWTPAPDPKPTAAPAPTNWGKW